MHSPPENGFGVSLKDTSPQSQDESSQYNALSDCYLSGQMSERQLQAHLENDVFRFWWTTTGPR
jgi:hypothetical protein